MGKLTSGRFILHYMLFSSTSHHPQCSFPLKLPLLPLTPLLKALWYKHIRQVFSQAIVCRSLVADFYPQFNWRSVVTDVCVSVVQLSLMIQLLHRQLVSGFHICQMSSWPITDLLGEPKSYFRIDRCGKHHPKTKRIPECAPVVRETFSPTIK